MARSTALPQKEYAELMIPSAHNAYGLAAHNLGMRSGQMKGDYSVGYGHLGATYGYQSITAYFPKLNIVVASASNIEINTQAQPALAMCYAYNAAASIILGRDIQCRHTPASYYSGSCICDQIDSDDVVQV